jgi:hypothetical protein
MVTKPREEFKFISEPKMREQSLIERIEEIREERQEVSSLLNESE